MNIKNVHVPLDKHSYAIHIGARLLANPTLLAPFIDSQQIAIVSNAQVAEHYLATLIDNLQRIHADFTIETVILPEGEAHKNQSSLDLIHDRLIEQKFSRDCLLIALGGGIVGDITGFAAASYQRGVDFIQIPTTLLAQVDSSVGGKTGINHRLGKNLIGAFHQPKTVIIDTDVLKTLPAREISAGMAEVIKYGLIRDKAFLHDLNETLEDAMALNAEIISGIIQQSCQHKADVVVADEKEHGLRATLNLGHTFGHAIESLTHYQTYLHGEAVAIGTMMALRLSARLGDLQADDVAFAEQLFQRAGCPTALSTELHLSAEHILSAMYRDKKVRAGKLKLILLEALGKAQIRDDISEVDILAAITSVS